VDYDVSCMLELKALFCLAMRAGLGGRFFGLRHREGTAVLLHVRHTTHKETDSAEFHADGHLCSVRRSWWLAFVFAFDDIVSFFMLISSRHSKGKS
jgi:hypothetical protein